LIGIITIRSPTTVFGRGLELEPDPRTRLNWCENKQKTTKKELEKIITYKVEIFENTVHAKFVGIRLKNYVVGLLIIIKLG
jgi:hypothetical protein